MQRNGDWADDEPDEDTWDGDDARWDDDQAEDEADDDATLPCPACGAAMFEEADRCPACGDYVTPGGRPSARPPWVILTAIVCLVAAVWWIVGGRP